MSKTLVMDNNSVDAILVEELTTLLLRLSDYTIDQEVALSLAEDNLEKLDLDNPFLAHKGLTWIANQIIKKEALSYSI